MQIRRNIAKYLAYWLAIGGNILCSVFFISCISYWSFGRIQQAVLYHDVKFYVIVFHAQSRVEHAQSRGGGLGRGATVSEEEFDALIPAKWIERETLSGGGLWTFTPYILVACAAFLGLASVINYHVFSDTGSYIPVRTGSLLLAAGLIVGSTAEFIAQCISPAFPVLAGITWSGFYMGYRLLSQDHGFRKALLLTTLVYGGCVCLHFLVIPFEPDVQRLRKSYRIGSTQNLDDVQTEGKQPK